jgi:hypothetical protein
MKIFPVHNVLIAGAVARARVVGLDRPSVPPKHLGPIDVTPQFRKVSEADEIDREIGNPGDQHNCPLCSEYFGWEAFKSHAQQCIDARAPRERIWTPPGMLVRPIQAYADTIRMEE